MLSIVYISACACRWQYTALDEDVLPLTIVCREVNKLETVRMTTQVTLNEVLYSC